MAGEKSSVHERSVQSDFLVAAKARIASMPALYKTTRRAGRTRSANAEAMVADLVSHFPRLSERRVAELLGVSQFYVRTVKAKAAPIASEYEDDHARNVRSCDAELATLNRVHGGFQYGIDPASLRERDTFATSDNLLDGRAHYKADQSHTIPRPITLPTMKMAA